MEIGCHLPTQGPLATGEALITFCRAAESRQIASLWVSDHVIFPRHVPPGYPGGRFPHPPDKPYLEPVAVLSAAAVLTQRAKLGASVFILGHRHPVVMAKLLTSIDALSNGRLICGVGVGWWKDELEILGVPFHARGPPGRRDPARVQGAVDAGQPRRTRASSTSSATSASRPSPCRSRCRRSGWAATAPAPSAASSRSATAGTRPRRRPPSSARGSGGCARQPTRPSGRSSPSRSASAIPLRDEELAQGKQAVIDLLAEYKRIGLAHIVLDFRRDDLGKMIEILDFVTGTIRPAVDSA